MKRIYETLAMRPERRLTDTVKAYVEANYASPIGLRHVAGALGYSGAYLSYLFRSQTGVTITAWIIRKRILAAAELLDRSGADVATACNAVGFNDLAYFARQYRRHLGTTPGRYRKGNAGPCPSGGLLQ